MIGRLLATAALAALVSCGGGGGGGPSPAPAPDPAAGTGASSGTGSGTAPAANVATITVDTGTDGSAINIPFVNVTICEPGTANCQTLDHVLVDSASFGLRVIASALPALSLPPVSNAAGTPVAECAQFATGFSWGSVRRADVKISGEAASNLPVQLVGDPAAPYATVPAACLSTGANFGAAQGGVKGILGVGTLNQDCGSACASSAALGIYYACASGGCTGTALPLASQVANPVAAFASDNNGVAITLPPVPEGGVSVLSGALIFGIGTQSNNQLGTATVYTLNNRGNFTTTYKGTNYTSSFIDSGSNAIFFSDPTIPTCSGFFCPASTLTLSAVNTSAGGVSGTVPFTIENFQSLPRTTAAAHIGADIGLARSFDWGLPFFFGRTVFVALNGAATPKGNGPYWAY
jgi:hypothetical protein